MTHSLEKLISKPFCCRIQQNRIKSGNNPDNHKFEELTEQTQKAKAQLDTIPSNEFDQLSFSLDLYSGLKRILKYECHMLISTNASLKIYEMINQMKLLEFPNNYNIKVFCNAELPGAFIVAINHYIRTMKPRIKLNWLASSYMPIFNSAQSKEDSTILGDTYGLYSGNRQNWMMGPKPNGMPGNKMINGDLMNADNVRLLSQSVKYRFGGVGANLYTSDAGIDVSSDYNNEEELTARLNFGQVLCGILSLAVGGNLVTKQFMFSTKFNRSLIALISQHFNDFYIVKPVTSRPLNSEIYLVGKNFRGISEELSEMLLDRLANWDINSPLDELNPGIDNSILNAAKCIYTQQIKFIDESMAIWRAGRTDFSQIAKKVQAEWLIDNPVIMIRPEMQLRQGKREWQERREFN